MMRLMRLWASVLLLMSAGCADLPLLFIDRDIESGFAFTNFSTRFYAALQIRPHGAGDGAWFQTPLLAPGATYRARYLDTLAAACPTALDLRVLLYRRIHSDQPIGLDAGEAVEPAPIAADEILDIPMCSVQPLEAFTIVNWDAPDGTARVKLAQGTPQELALLSMGRFPNVDGAWEFSGVRPDLAAVPPPVHAEMNVIAGRVTTPAGAGVPDVLVLLRTRFRVRLDDADPSNDPDVGYSEPIDFTVTDADGGFSFLRPPGAYQVEFFSDDVAFRPGAVEVESPIDEIRVIAEPL